MIPKHVEISMAKLTEMGVHVEEDDDSILVTANEPLKSIGITTIPYPGFPTDMHPQFAPLLCIADGVGTISEGVWENRFRYVEELRKMGANILVGGDMATFIGGQRLMGASSSSLLSSTRRRASAVVTGLEQEYRK